MLKSLLGNPCGLLAVGLVLYLAGDWASGGREKLRRFGAGLSGLALIAVIGWGIAVKMPSFTLALGAAGFGLAVLGSLWIVFSVLAFLGAAYSSVLGGSNVTTQKADSIAPGAPLNWP